MKKSFLPILVSIIVFTLACSIGYEGLVIGSDPDVDHIYEMTETASAPGFEPITSGGIPVNRVDIPEEPGSAGDSSSSTTSNVLPPSGDQVEYTVSATNNGCTCQVNGNMSLALDIQGDSLFYNLPDGTSQEFMKINDNMFKRSYMGYYILVDSSSGQEVETRVDEERHDVIILTQSGFISEHYQGNEGSPCCYHTFTRLGETP
jgi:hypothetical protein